MKAYRAILITVTFFGAMWITAEAADEDSALGLRLSEVKSQHEDRWVITPYRPNYVMPLTYMSEPNKAPFESSGDDDDFDRVEVKFQISFMMQAIEDLLFANGDLFFAYTQVSFWQAYNSDISEAFRDTNYEPEFFLLFDTDNEFFGWRNNALMLGAVHQSNGRGLDALSRSWNRVYANILMEKGNWLLTLKPWLRVSDDEENPRIDEYLGYGQALIAYKHEEHLFSALLRNNFKADGNRGAVEVNWTFPLSGRFRGIVQYFNGYGENLLDYDHHGQRVGIGVMLSDLL